MKRIDAKALLENASRTEEGESFTTVERWDGIRIGAGARAPGTFFVEVLITLFPRGEVSVDRLEKALQDLRWLESRGYRLSCRDDHAVCGERCVSVGDLEEEIRAAVMSIGPPV